MCCEYKLILIFPFSNFNVCSKLMFLNSAWEMKCIEHLNLVKPKLFTISGAFRHELCLSGQIHFRHQCYMNIYVMKLLLSQLYLNNSLKITHQNKSCGKKICSSNLNTNFFFLRYKKNLLVCSAMQTAYKKLLGRIFIYFINSLFSECVALLTRQNNQKNIYATFQGNKWYCC